VTVDVQTVGDEKGPPDGKITVRARDSMGQIRVPISHLATIMADLMEGNWAEVAKSSEKQTASSSVA